MLKKRRPKPTHTTVKLTIERHQQARVAHEKDCVRAGKWTPFQDWLDRVIEQHVQE